MLDNELPSNYHNVTETRMKIGGNDVDVKKIIDKNTGKNRGGLVQFVVYLELFRVSIAVANLTRPHGHL